MMNKTLEYHRLLFEEEQRPSEFWMLVTVFFCVFILIGLMRTLWDGMFDLNLLLSIVMIGGVSILVVLSLAGLRLSTRLDANELHVRLWPFPGRRVRIEDIARWEERKYRPLLTFGGWGIRGSFAEGQWAFTMRGDQAVQLHLRNGRRLLIGTQRPAELAAAMEEAKTGGDKSESYNVEP